MDSTFRGKINLALKYSRKNNCLHVKINRCTQLLPMDNGKSSDPFVEVCVFIFFIFLIFLFLFKIYTQI